MNTFKKKKEPFRTRGASKAMAKAARENKIDPEFRQFRGKNPVSDAFQIEPDSNEKTVADLRYSDYEIASLAISLEEKHGKKPPGYYHSEALEHLLAARD